MICISKTIEPFKHLIIDKNYINYIKLIPVVDPRGDGAIPPS